MNLWLLVVVVSGYQLDQCVTIHILLILLSFLVLVMPKRSRSSFSGGYRKKARKGTKRSFKKNTVFGDISRVNFNAFGRTIANPLKVHPFIGRTGSGNLVGTAISGAGVGYTFQLNQCVQYTDWVAVYDQYRIVAVEISFSPIYNTITKTVDGQGRLFTCIDYDDAAAPTGPNDVRRFDTCIVTNAYSPVTRRLVPRCADALYSGAFTSYGSSANRWIDCASPGVQHYGVKAWVDPSTSVPTTYSVEIKMYLEFRGQHNA